MTTIERLEASNAALRKALRDIAAFAEAGETGIPREARGWRNLCRKFKLQAHEALACDVCGAPNIDDLHNC